MKIRPTGGQLADTMKRVEEIEPTAEAVCAWLNRDPMVASGLMRPAEPADLRQRRVGNDPRTGWDTWYVSLPGMPPLAQTDGPIPEQETAPITPRRV